MAFSASCKGFSRYVIGCGASSRRREHRLHNDSVSLRCQHHGYQVRTDLLARTRLVATDINLRHVETCETESRKSTQYHSGKQEHRAD